MIIMTIKTGGGDAVDGHDHEASGEDDDDYYNDVPRTQHGSPS